MSKLMAEEKQGRTTSSIKSDWKTRAQDLSSWVSTSKRESQTIDEETFSPRSIERDSRCGRRYVQASTSRLQTNQCFRTTRHTHTIRQDWAVAGPSREMTVKVVRIRDSITTRSSKIRQHTKDLCVYFNDNNNDNNNLQLSIGTSPSNPACSNILQGVDGWFGKTKIPSGIVTHKPSPQTLHPSAGTSGHGVGPPGGSVGAGGSVGRSPGAQSQTDRRGGSKGHWAKGTCPVSPASWSWSQVTSGLGKKE